MSTPIFDAECRRCERLSAFLCDVKARHPTYHSRPVAPFGSVDPVLLVVGLAPGMHGANATGRPFTGDFAGILLYETLHAFGFADRPVSESYDDGLVLSGCRITNAVKCLPPQNKPTGQEVAACNAYLQAELSGLREGAVVLALGAVAHHAVLRAYDLKARAYPFAHNRLHPLPGGRCLIDSYHCSRYNVQTRRLTADMFQDVFRTVMRCLDPR